MTVKMIPSNPALKAEIKLIPAPNTQPINGFRIGTAAEKNLPRSLSKLPMITPAEIGINTEITGIQSTLDALDTLYTNIGKAGTHNRPVSPNAASSLSLP